MKKPSFPQNVMRSRAAVLVAVSMVVFAVVAIVNPAFASWDRVVETLTRAAPVIIIGVGVGVVVIAGEIDISVGAMYGTLAALLGVLASPTHAGWPAWAAVAAVVGAGGVIGAVNGALTVVGRVPSIVATLGMMSVLRGVTERILRGDWVTDLPPGLRAMGTGSVGGVPLSVVLALMTLLAGVLLTRRTAWGVRLYATGDNAVAASFARAKPAAVRMGAFVMSGVLVGVAVAVSVPQLSVVESGLGVGLELAVVTAIVVGGVSIRGGSGLLAGVAVAAVLLAMIRSGLIFLKLGPQAVYWEQAINGVFILGAVLLDRGRADRASPPETAGGLGVFGRVTPLIAVTAVVFGVAWWAAPGLLGWDVQASLVPQLAEVALLAAPMTLVILTGGIDLSVGSSMALAAVTAGLLHRAGAPSSVCAMGAISVGSMCGALNGVVVTRAKIHPLIVTLATMALYRGLAQGVSGGAPVSGFAEGWVGLGSARALGLPLTLLPAIVVGVVAWIALARTGWGLRVRAIGMNETAARYCGAPVDRIKVGVYTLCGAAAGAAACLFIARRNTAKADIGLGIELEVITACVLGGVSLVGGRGSVLGVGVGLVLIHELRQLFAWLQYPDEVILIVLGVVLIASVLAGEHALSLGRLIRRRT